MASAELRIIRRRIKSVESTTKITRAMELIATARIGKAQSRLNAARPYAEKLDEVIRNVSGSGGAQHPLLERRAVKSVGALVVTSDRGLAGGYNTGVIRLAERKIIEYRNQGVGLRIYAVGQKALSYFRYRNYQIERSWLGVTDLPTFTNARVIAATILNDYVEEAVDAVAVFTTRYVSALTQVAVHNSLLPIEAPSAGQDATGAVAYSFEPSPEDILSRLLPRYLEGAMFQVLLEASASEHAARRRAMTAATENAEELTRILTREANQARQAEITTEISEIVGGAEALSAG